MNTEGSPEDIDSTRSESGDGKSPLPKRDDDVLLERLKGEPPLRKQAPLPLTLGIVAAALALGVILFFIFRKPETFVSTTPPLGEHSEQTSNELTLKRTRLAPLIDSLEKAVKTADNPASEVALANAYYDAEYWDKALALYEHYLEHKPDDINARIDYAFSITQVSADYTRAIGEIEKALAIDPDHVQGLFNAGILSLRANINDKEAALKSARAYFLRAKTAAAKQGNAQMSSQINEILKEMDKVAADSAATPAR